MSNNNFTGRGFGASGAHTSAWRQPRDSYKAPTQDGTNFIFGGGGTRGTIPAGSNRQTTNFKPDIAPPKDYRDTHQREYLNPPQGSTGSSDRNETPKGIFSADRRSPAFIFGWVLIAIVTYSLLAKACDTATTSWKSLQGRSRFIEREHR